MISDLLYKNRIWLCGIADAIGMIILLLLPIALFGEPDDLKKFFTTYLTFFLPLALIACWRGMKDATKIIAGNYIFYRAPLEGFIWGFTTSITFWFIDYISEVMAAGGHFDEVIGHPTNIYAWLKLLAFVLPFSFVTGIIGSMIATVLHLLNRFLVSLMLS
jgi:hypothetical protein